MKKAIKYIYDANPFYGHWKKYVCPKCGSKVELRYVSKIVNSKSPEAKDYDFSVGDTFLWVMLNLEQDISIALNVSWIFLFKR